MGEWLRRRRRLREESGATAVEFALIMMPLLYLVFGVIQYSLYFYSMQSGTSAVGDSVRRLSVGDCQTTLRAQDVPLQPARVPPRPRRRRARSSPAVTYTKADGTTATAPGEVGGQRQGHADLPHVSTCTSHSSRVPSSGTVTRAVVARVEDTTATTGGCT